MRWKALNCTLLELKCYTTKGIMILQNPQLYLTGIEITTLQALPYHVMSPQLYLTGIEIANGIHCAC